MLLEIASTTNVIFNCLADVVQFIQQNPEIGELVPEYKKLLRILLTIPATSCTNERSFSALKYLKNYLRSTMLQKRLNNISILYTHQDIVDQLDIELLMNEFIKKNNKRASTFAM
ncbi:Zinc finger MYM-type protein 1 [Cyphomyrmex costatus]|uniref:Zinc finger MYM-type protein 1 n=1 Tax=Cyphomyrmex costatus TaxID=456900 RepID=A0A151IN87_9HYME|nr:Zinc finger MYM-type protein 1 [Cyphomyrmex costatus]